MINNRKFTETLLNTAEADDLFTRSLELLEQNDTEAALEHIMLGLATTESIEQFFAFCYLQELAIDSASEVRKGILNNVYNLF